MSFTPACACTIWRLKNSVFIGETRNGNKVSAEVGDVTASSVEIKDLTIMNSLIILMETNAVTKNGAADTFTVELSEQPGAGVTVTLDSETAGFC